MRWLALKLKWTLRGFKRWVRGMMRANGKAA